MIYIGIDPGANGGIASIIEHDNKIINIVLNVYDDVEMLHHILIGFDYFDWKWEDKPHVFIEKNWPRPGSSATRTYNFGLNNGRPIGLLRAFHIEPNYVPPQVWKKVVGVTKDKQSSIDMVHKLFPDVSLLPTKRCKKEHDGMAEALLIAEYGRRLDE